VSRIALTLVFLFLLWRLFAPEEPAIPPEHQASLLPAIAYEAPP